MLVKLTKVSSPRDHFPWERLRSFTERHEEIFTPGTYTQVKLGVIDERNTPPSYNAKLAFLREGTDSDIDVYGEISSSDNTVTRIVLDLENQTGEMDIPELHVRVDITGDEFLASAPDGTPAHVYRSARDYLRRYWRVLDFLTDEGKIVQNNLGRMMLEKYPWRFN